MSSEFKDIRHCFTGMDSQDLRGASVEAALVLINSRISACSSGNALNEALHPDTISKLADNIELALKLSK